MLRFIAMIGIVIAHVSPPDFWMQFRNFDVPLMAMVMGMSFYLSNKNSEMQYGSYVIKRLKRLVIPTWQFLTFFIGGLSLVHLVFGKDLPFDWWQVLSSYLLLDGIGYVWIIGVFVAVAMLNPFILRFSLRTKENSKYFLILGMIYLGYLGLTVLNQSLNEITAFFFEHLVLYTIGYGLIAAIGIRFKQLSKKEIWIGFIGSILIYLILAFVNDFYLVSMAKYPPTTYYISYAIGAIFGLTLLLDVKAVFNVFDNKLVYYISKNSMWFYLWHIIPVYFIGVSQIFIPILETSWVARFLYVLIVSMILTIGHKWLVKKTGDIRMSKTENAIN